MRSTDVKYTGEHSDITILERKITDARIILRVTKPFYSLVIFSLKAQHSYKIPTTAVTHDGRFLWNPYWVDHLTVDDLVFEEAHEAWHICQNCISRGRNISNLDHAKWNRAADDITDTLLVKDELIQSSISKEIVTFDIMKEASEDKTIEVRYDRLMQKSNGQNSNSPKIKSLVDSLLQSMSASSGLNDITGTPEDSAEFEQYSPGCISLSILSEAGQQPKTSEAASANLQKTQHTILSAKATVDSMNHKGSVPSEVNNWIAALATPVIRWTDHIRYLASQVYQKQYTYKRISYRRGGDTGLRFPVMRPKTGIGTVVLFDGSYSCANTEWINRVASEIGGILKACNCPEIWMLFHDTRVYHAAPFSMKELTDLRISRGGTDHNDCFNVLAGKGSVIKSIPFKPNLVIAMTDLESCFPKEAPKIPIIWCGIAGRLNKDYYPGYGFMLEIPEKVI